MLIKCREQNRLITSQLYNYWVAVYVLSVHRVGASTLRTKYTIYGEFEDCVCVCGCVCVGVGVCVKNISIR